MLVLFLEASMSIEIVETLAIVFVFIMADSKNLLGFADFRGETFLQSPRVGVANVKIQNCETRETLRTQDFSVINSSHILACSSYYTADGMLRFKRATR